MAKNRSIWMVIGLIFIFLPPLCKRRPRTGGWLPQMYNLVLSGNHAMLVHFVFKIE